MSRSSSPSLRSAKPAEATIPAQRGTAAQLNWVDRMSDLMDTKYVIPGTKIRFGLDFLLGLIPGVGDAISFAFSGVLVATLARHGASPRLLARMLVNLMLDALVGSVPVLGNVFDLFFKANRRNVMLMREHYVDGKHTGSIWPVLAAVVGAVVLLFAGLVGFGIMIFRWVFQ